MTAAGFCEVKTLPVRTVLRASTRGEYFQENNGLFRRLFQAINQNKVPMTVPVEAKMKPGTMIFYLDQASAKRGDLQLPAGVTRQSLPSRTVASVGIRGGYTRESYEENLAKLRGWLQTQKNWRVAGEPYAVYWNGPFTLAPFKRSEVHLPVQKIN
jgi:effector-binding domain-containing protein